MMDKLIPEKTQLQTISIDCLYRNYKYPIIMQVIHPLSNIYP